MAMAMLAVPHPMALQLILPLHREGNSPSPLSLSPVPPGPPTNLQVTGQTTTTLSISWTNPTFNGFSDIASFRVQVTERGSTFPYTFIGDEETTTFTLTGLLPFTNYTVRLFVRNAVGLEGQPAETTGMTDSLCKL